METDKSNILNNTKFKNKKNYSVKFFRLNNEDDYFMYDSCLQAKPDLIIVDELYAQLTDLIKIRNPHLQLSDVEIENRIAEHIGESTIDTYGVWVYYSWRNMMVHLLDQDEFLEVKTNRNKNKITAQEQAQLRAKKVGVIGLSVGSSAASTIVMEAGCGEIRLADFDNLDLSNCNRIRTGVFNINLPKVIITAREILEIDPFLNVKCFFEGITEQNIDNFFNEGGKLDLVVEECDSIEIKILARIKAKENIIPLVMEMSDRGMIDIERYDLDPDYKMFHGKIEHLNILPSKLKNLSLQEKVEYLYPMIGGESVSERLLASSQEIGKTLLTWPQLASAVVLGGGICADVVRRIFLSQFSKSGRFYVDLEEIISN